MLTIALAVIYFVVGVYATHNKIMKSNDPEGTAQILVCLSILGSIVFAPLYGFSNVAFVCIALTALSIFIGAVIATFKVLNNDDSYT